MRPLDRKAWAVAAIAIAAMAGCAAVETVVNKTADSAANAGVISKDAAKSTQKVTAAFRKSAEEFTDSEEHYIGRSVAAQMFMSYKPVDDQPLNAYVNRVGAAVALASDRPETFAGYHFEVLDSDEVNAFAAPGGLIFITRGTLRLCEDEDMLAGVLAHEVAHVVLKHGLKAISASRLKAAFGVLTGETAQVLTDHQAKELSQVLEGSVADITGAITTGYSKGSEEDADELACTYAARAGYDPWGIVRFLEAMKRHEGTAKGGTFATHPKAEERLETAQEKIEDDKLKAGTAATTRLPRFKAAVKL